MQLETSQSEIPLAYTEATVNSYVQLYDERGNPINPRSNSYAKRLRDAQNDVLASVGVVERRISQYKVLPGSYAKHLEVLDTEDTLGNIIALTTTLTENMCTWWIGSIRERVLTFRYQDAIPFSRIVEAEWAVSGVSIVYGGFAARLFSTMSMQAIVYGTHIYQPTHRLLQMTRATNRTRNFFRRWQRTISSVSRFALEIIFYPFSYRSSLERLGLVSASSLSLLWSPPLPFQNPLLLQPFSMHSNASASALNFAKAVLTSPVLYVCLEHVLERWIYANIFEAVDSSILRPDHSEIQSRDAGEKDRAMIMLGLKRQSPPLIRNMINRLLTAIGWAKPLQAKFANQSQYIGRVEEDVDPLIEEVINVGGTEITNLAPLQVPVVEDHGQQESRHFSETSEDASHQTIRAITPPSPVEDNANDEYNDPRIRITSREGVVEMEVRLPSALLSSYTERIDREFPLGVGGDGSTADGSTLPFKASKHRVTQLSIEPAQMIGAMVKAQLLGLALLPLKMITLRMVASHYLCNQKSGHLRPIRPLFCIEELSWRSVGIQVSRIALCSTLELSVDLALWGVQYVAITQVGRKFGWGGL